MFYFKKEMPRRKTRCKCKKCVLKLEVTNSLGELIPGPRGPQGPQGQVIAEVPRSLKVQLMGSEIVPIINQGFLWENNVLPPPGFSLPGTFTFYRATVLDQEGFSIAEMFNSNGGINTTQTDEVHTSALLHYRNGVQQDMHSVSSQTPGTENFLLAQTLHDVVIGDQLYFAISPNVTDLTAFNYTLGSVRLKPSAKFGRNSFVTIPIPGSSAGQIACLVITEEIQPSDTTQLFISMSAAAGGGGAGQDSSFDGTTEKIGRGGGGGGVSTCVLSATWNLHLVKGDVLEVFPGYGGGGGTSSNPDGGQGEISYVKLNKGIVLLPGGIPTPTPGGFGGFGGINGGGGADSTGGGGGGGGGGAPWVDGTVGIPGSGGSASGGFTAGATGGTNPRNGGFSTSFNGGTVPGGKGGNNNDLRGSGGGAGGVSPSNGSPIPSGVSNGGHGGSGGINANWTPASGGGAGSDGDRSNTAATVLGGGGGGSGGSQNFLSVSTSGGHGGKGTDAQIVFSSESS